MSPTPASPKAWLAPLLLAAALLLPGPARAADHRFEAQLAAPPPAPEVIASALRWRCEGARCTTAAAMVAPPASLCARLAREVGRLAGFSVDGEPIAAAALDRCNRRARAQAP